MFRRKNKQQNHERASEYATCKDFQQIFTEDMAALHQLAFLLTADQAQAEQCFVAGLNESIRGNPVFLQWARAWSKRAIIQNAIKTMSPSPKKRGAQETRESRDVNDLHEISYADVTKWPAFERFVFVMAVLEGYTLRECSAMLTCSDQDVITAKTYALQWLASKPAPVSAERDASPWSAISTRAQVA
jgi:hypothetical protein